ncbi:hypothetical protein [Hymenobacter guriensis]|uniref:Uncharacterized protein n=1 Tax=Hymenobacter guriensis TaxID=2793065 RepID=A0ABS0KXG7_9BACT|nr:hypothetical protein [Hymenobacter guriensis]MBG8552567.1 hypothetical protein [Hymenobacter guriensis]
MQTTVEKFDGKRAIVRFRPTFEIEPKILAGLQANQLPERYQLTVMSWVEEGLERRGYPNCSVLEFEGYNANGSYQFRVERSVGLGGY